MAVHAESPLEGSMEVVDLLRACSLMQEIDVLGEDAICKLSIVPSLFSTLWMRFGLKSSIWYQYSSAQEKNMSGWLLKKPIETSSSTGS